MSDLEQLVLQTLTGESQAWPALQAAVSPTIAKIARGHRQLRRKGLAVLPDDVAEIVVASLERLARSDFQNLRRYAAQRSEPDAARTESFDAWLYGMVDFTIREHIRRRFGRAPAPLPEGEVREQAAPSKRDVQSLAGRFDDTGAERAFLGNLSMTAKLTLAEIFAHIARDFAPNEAVAMRMYYAEDRSFQEIAAALELADDKAADKLIRRLNARLRYRFEHT